MKSVALLACIACLLVSSFSLLAQQHGTCGFDAAHRKMLVNNPSYRAAVEGIENNARLFHQQKDANQRIAEGVYIMPVVVHVVHTGGAEGSVYNPTDARIQGAIAYLNSVYNGTAPGRNGEGTGDVNIQFELAKRDPNCNPTNGINHVNGSSLAGYVANGVKGDDPTDVALKNFIRWDPTRYCNIWVVNKIGGNDGEFGGTTGYAYFPFNPTVDGVVILARAMVSDDITLAHEMGHVFTLYHPFEGSGPNGTTCPPIANTTSDGDQITDTDPITVPPDFFADRTGTVNLCADPGGTVNYKIETEHNIMNYVNVARLFTAGQKTRMLAGAGSFYRNGQILSLADIDPDQGASPCVPKVNFELSEYHVTEATAATITVGGCTRAYKDYTFNMVIGRAPSAAAIATLAASGATEGVDFDITTTDFTSPSKVVTFPTSGNGMQSFKVRIYDDAIVDGTDTISLSFTLANGGGNAVKGTGRPGMAVIVADNDIAPHGPVDGTVTLNGDNNFIVDVPFYGKDESVFKSQFLYKASELKSRGINAGNITGFSMDITKKGSAGFVYKNLTIKMGQTTLPALFKHSAPTGGSGVNDAAHTVVFSADHVNTNGVNTFNFSAPFVWDGTSNITVTICYNNGSSFDTGNDEVLTYSDDYSADSSSFMYQWSNCSTNMGGASFGVYFNNYKPVITFMHTTPATEVITALNASRSEYLGPDADIYFYDQATSQLLARVQNLSSWDYGCTQVITDRAGTGASSFQSSTDARKLMDKTFRVLPAQNNPSGSYKLTLYYTQQEVEGWQTATSNSFNDIQFIKVPGQISNVTPATPNAEGTPQVIAPTERGTLSTSYSLTSIFSNGFSGFGAGIAAAVLPVRLVDLNGKQSGNDIVITWSTSSETNSKLFEIERSGNGVDFIKIGTVSAKGNSTFESRYEFRDLNNIKELNYYRIKMIDIDGRSEYTKIISVQSLAGNKMFAVVNPLHDNLDIQFGQITSGIAEVRMLNASGQAVLRWRGMVSAGQHTLLPLNSAITRGVYTVQVLQGDQQFIRKLIKP